MKTGGLLLVCGCVAALAGPAPRAQFRPDIPRVWDDAALAEWATPVAGLNVRPTHISASEYYSLSVENLRTYPVYFPGREPKGYWDMLQHVGPQPLVEPQKLTTEADWIEAGRQVFEQVDNLHLRTIDPKFIQAARSKDTFEGLQPLPDGSTTDLRWVPTKEGVALSSRNCGGCHLTYLPDRTPLPGGPFGRFTRSATTLADRIQTEKRVVNVATPFFMGPEPFGTWLYQAGGVPWRKDDINERLKTITEDEYRALRVAAFRGTGFARWNGSLFYPAKVPDLIGIKDRKYIDHTATHLHRGIGDLMRYAALVSFAEATDFGPHQMLGPQTTRVQARLSDEALYALGLYIYSLQPPPNPNPFDARAVAGQQIFAREGCPTCHTPPLYTSNKLTLAQGFEPPPNVPGTLDILRRSVGTDPGLALMTRKGTGYYKVPSLKGVWYRGHYLHDGSAASLEEMFDAGRLLDTHRPGGSGSDTRAIKGHEFGLRVSPTEREQLLAFLRTL